MQATTTRTRTALVALLVTVGVASGALPSDAAGIVVERLPGGARLWVSAERSVDAPLEPHRTARTAVEAEDGLVVAGTDEASGGLFFVHVAEGSTTDLPVPGSRTGAIRRWPVLLTEAGRLEGALWLEGSPGRELDLRAAAWNGTSWEDVERVSPARGRPQLAPSAAVLDDGSWLAVWAGYDGEDDEIFWSRRADGAWSAPRRLHPGNRVPDILPAVIAHGDDARAAWSTFDGADYRIATARYENGDWVVEGALEGLGAVDARWERVGDRVFVTYHSVVPEAWHLVEVGVDGDVVRATRAAGEVTEPPLVEAAPGSGPRLVFPTRGGRVRP